jgi:TolB-like protein
VPAAGAALVCALAACAGSAARPAAPPAPRTAADSAGRDALARERAGMAAATVAAALASPGGLRTLGVAPFAVAAGDSALAPLAYALADLLTTDLARSARLTLVERARLGDVLRELDLSATGRVDAATAPRVGRLLQAGQLVFGTLGSTGRPASGARGDAGTLRLGVRLADVRTGAIAQAVDASAPLADVLAAEKQLAFRLLDALGVTLTPAERAAIEQRPTANLAALLAYGRGVQRQVEGDFRGARAEFQRAARLDPGFRVASDRAAQVRTLGETGTSVPVVVPGLRPIDGAVSNTIDRLNRPLDGITTLARPASATDPSFPVTTTTVVLVITRP